jgi:hypothetical protein
MVTEFGGRGNRARSPLARRARTLAAAPLARGTGGRSVDRMWPVVITVVVVPWLQVRRR